MFLVGKRNVAGEAYLAGVDGLRAFAVLSVLIFHLSPEALPGGFVGVDTFFVISGYVVTKSLSHQKSTDIGSFILNFYSRRLRRILPPLLLCLGITITVAFAVIPDAWLSMSIPATGMSAFFGMSNFALMAADDGYFGTQSAANPFTHTWSLAVEEQFYLLFPPILYCTLDQSNKGVRLFGHWFIGALIAASLVFCTWATFYNPSAAYYMLPSRFWELAVGAVAAMIGEGRRSSIVERIGQAFLMNVGFALTVFTAIFADRNSFPIPWAIPACAGSLAVILASGFPSTSRSFGRVFEHPVFVTIGLLSYSLYLWHWPIYTIMRWTVGLDRPFLYVIALSLTLAAACLSYLLVEYPTQSWPIFKKMRAATVVTTAVVLMVTGFFSARFIYRHPSEFKLTVVEMNKSDWYSYWGGGTATDRICDVSEEWDGKSLTLFSPKNCRLNVQNSNHIFLIGDSHAGSYNRLMRNIVSATGASVSIHSATGCSVANFMVPADARKDRCGETETYLSGLKKSLRQGDIVFLSSLRTVRTANQDGPIPQMEIARLTVSDLANKRRAEALREAEQIIHEFSSRGVTLIFDLPAPVFVAPAFRCADWFNASNPVCAPGLTVTRREFNLRREPAVAAMVQATAGNPSTFLWDPAVVLCPGDPCKVFRDSRPLFFDQDHLSGFGNDVLTPSFIDLLNSISSSKRPNSHR